MKPRAWILLASLLLSLLAVVSPAQESQPGVLTTSLAAPPRWMSDGEFAVQVVMWNPTVFPGMPEQHTAGLHVRVLPDGSVIATPYGTDQGGLAIWHEVDTNANGQRVIRFPFSIPGL